MSRLTESMDVQFKYKLKTWAFLGVVVLFGVIVFKIFSFFSHLNEEIALQRLSFGIAQMAVLSPMAVDNAKMDVKAACQEDIFTNQVKHPDECAAAKKKLEVAEAENAKVQAGKERLFDQGLQTQDYYSGWVKAVKKEPFYWFVLIIGFIITGGIIAYMTIGYIKNQKGEAAAAGGL